MQGIVETIAKLCEMQGLQNSAAPAQQKIQEVALRDLGVNSLDSKFLRVSDAAIDIGLGDWYSACNKNLSKLAHPTAGLILGMMHQGSRLRNLQAICTTQGLFFAGQCVTALDRFILAIPTS
jgi:hypothetical protein